MGRFKRIKQKQIKEKRFANVKMILNLIQSNKVKIESIPKDILQVEKRNINFGDEWNSEDGYEYLIFFSDKSAYLVGETIVREDRDDWGQAESWEVQHCVDYYQERGTINALEVLEKLETVIL